MTQYGIEPLPPPQSIGNCRQYLLTLPNNSAGFYMAVVIAWMINGWDSQHTSALSVLQNQQKTMRDIISQEE